MKKKKPMLVELIIIAGLAYALCIALTGCNSTTLTTYDKDGKIQTVEKVDADAVALLILSLKHKMIVGWKSGWCAYVKACPGDQDNPTPIVTMWGGNLDDGYISIPEGMNLQGIDWIGIAKVVSATRGNLSISPTGITGGPVK